MPLRDPERTRERLLSAAEDLFAEDGYEHTTMQAVGERAGYARSTPAYFFGSKDDLYRAVLMRLFERAQAVLSTAHEAAAGDAGRPREMLESLIGAYLDFVADDENFVSIVQRESATRRTWLRETLEHALVVGDALGALTATLGERLTPAQARHLVVSVSALVWYPFAQAHTLLAALGIDPRDAAFREEHKRQITNVLLAALAAESPTGNSSP